ncbi:hypothetical protein [Stenotrophomonas phage CM2]
MAPLLAHGSVEEVVGFLDRREELEAAATGGGDKSKIDAIVEGRIKSRLAPLERERDTLKSKLGEVEGALSEFKTRENERVIGDAIRGAAAKTKGFNPAAIEDALLLGSRALSPGWMKTAVWSARATVWMRTCGSPTSSRRSRIGGWTAWAAELRAVVVAAASRTRTPTKAGT